MPEEEAFAVMVKLMQEYRLREIFKPSMAELGLVLYQLKNIVEVLSLSIQFLNFFFLIQIYTYIFKWYKRGGAHNSSSIVQGCTFDYCYILISHAHIWLQRVLFVFLFRNEIFYI